MMSTRVNRVALLLSALGLSLASCNGNQEEPETPDAVDSDGPMEEAGEWTDETAEDAADSIDEAAEETGDAVDEAEDEVEEEVDE